jgi:hypothetical protein
MGVKIAGAGEPATVSIRIVGFIEQVSAVFPEPFTGIAPSLEVVDPAIGGFTVPPPATLIEPEPPLFGAAGDEPPAAVDLPDVFEGDCAGDLSAAVLPFKRAPPPEAMGWDDAPGNRPVGWRPNFI